MGHRDAEQEGISAASGNLATARRDWFQNWYRKLGFNITVPFPPVSDPEFRRRKGLGQAIFYRPATLEVSYEALMQVFGEGNHWTIKDNDNRQKIKWEPTLTGYWFWAEVAQDCPRINTSWYNFGEEQMVNLVSIEEYAIIFLITKAETSVSIDVETASWLRTRFDQEVLDASCDFNDRIRVWPWHGATTFAAAAPCDLIGARHVEKVESFLNPD